MPHPNNLKIMGALPHQYNALKPDQKDDFNKEAERRLIELQQTDMEAYIALTNEPIEAPVEIDPKSERRFF
jgi:phage I-like protein